MKLNFSIFTIAFDNIINKKRRSLLSVVAIMLSVAIIFVSLTLFSLIMKYSRMNTSNSFHYFLLSKDVEYDPYYYKVDNDVVYGYYGEYQSDFFSIHGISQESTFIDIEGSYPKESNEILIPSSYDIDIGETIELSYQEASITNGNYYLEDKFELDKQNIENRTYKVVGKYSLQDASLSKNVTILYTAITNDYQRSYVYVTDFQVHKEDSLSKIADKFNTSKQDIYINSDVIASDSIASYLQDTTTLLIMFLFITVIAIFMSIVSVYNVLIVNDQDRRKEIGLLKSIGVTSTELKMLLIIELLMLGVIGSLVGIIFGSVVGYLVLKVVFYNFHLKVTLSLLINPLIIVGSCLIGILLMIISGYLLYRKYFYSSAISDLKGNVVHYNTPYNPERFTVTTVTWRLFVIYNERIKKQTRNIRRSFFFIILTITLFTGVALSNIMFRINYNEVEYDLLLKEKTMALLENNLYYDLGNDLYQLYEENSSVFEVFTLQRRIVGISGYVPFEYINEDNNDIDIESNILNDGMLYTKLINRCYLLDEHQINLLMGCENIIYGNNNALTNDGVILIANGDLIDQSNINQNNLSILISSVGDSAITTTFSVDAVVFLDSNQYPQLSFDGDYIIAFTSENYSKAMQIPESSYIETTLHVELFDSSDNKQIEKEINKVLTTYSLHNDFDLTNYVSIKEDGAVATFMIEILLYPLFLMLVMIGAININNVLKGNMHMKRRDFSIMKSVGITTTQLRGIMIFEYIENYINGGLETMLLCIPIIFIEKYVNIASVFKVSDNYVGTMILSFCIFTPIIVVLLAMNSFRELIKITPIENTNDTN